MDSSAGIVRPRPIASGSPGAPLPKIISDRRERRVTFGELAALIAACAFLVLVGVIAIPVLRLRHTVDAATRAVNDLTDRTGPILANVNTTVENVNATLGQVQTSLDGVNVQLARIDTIT